MCRQPENHAPSPKRPSGFSSTLSFMVSVRIRRPSCNAGCLTSGLVPRRAFVVRASFKRSPVCPWPPPATKHFLTSSSASVPGFSRRVGLAPAKNDDTLEYVRIFRSVHCLVAEQGCEIILPVTILPSTRWHLVRGNDISRPTDGRRPVMYQNR
ncbi:hypothetical protein B0H14DRAFT_2747497 [Mycena olivaceomarginata]|nr:hypothetical protein B0H14DRAFT_2747497 [Mycena olivaceomarginata]